MNFVLILTNHQRRMIVLRNGCNQIICITTRLIKHTPKWLYKEIIKCSISIKIIFFEFFYKNESPPNSPYGAHFQNSFYCKIFSPNQPIHQTYNYFKKGNNEKFGYIKIIFQTNWSICFCSNNSGKYWHKKTIKLY